MGSRGPGTSGRITDISRDSRSANVSRGSSRPPSRADFAVARQPWSRDSSRAPSRSDLVEQRLHDECELEVSGGQPAVGSRTSPTPRRGRAGKMQPVMPIEDTPPANTVGGTFSSHFGKASPRDSGQIQRLPPSPISLDGLWLLLVSQWRTLPEALDGAGLGTCEEFGEEEVFALCSGSVGDSRSEDATAMLMRELRVPAGARATRDRLLSTLGRVPPRQRFRDFANTMLLMFANVLELGGLLSNGGRPTARAGKDPTRSWEKSGKMLIGRQEFREALLLFDVHLNDATMWFEALCEWPQEKVDLGALMRRIVSQPWLEGDADIAVGVGVGTALAQEDVAVRLIHIWGDLSAAFSLKARVERSSSMVLRPASADRRNFSAHAHQPAKEAPSTSPPNLDAWQRALRGSARARLLAEADVKTQAARQVTHQREVLQRELGLNGLNSYSHSCLISLFPNLSEFICISRANFFPLELVVVRYSTDNHGFLGAAITNGRRRPNFGASPFIAIVPLGSETELFDATSPRTRLTEPQHSAPLTLNGRNPGTVALRAPCQISSGGTDGLWAVQLFASEDGQHAIAPVGSPLPMRVVARPPQVPGRPTLVSCTDTTLALTWNDPLDDGGTAIVTYVLGLWLASEWWEGATPVVVCQESNVWPPFEVNNLMPETKYIARVRCETEGGSSPWSEVSDVLETMRPAPGDIGKPQVGEINPTSVTVSWGPNDWLVTLYEVEVLPSNDCEPWSISVAPPPTPSSVATSPPPTLRSSSPGPGGKTRRKRTTPRGAQTPPKPVPSGGPRWTKVVVDGLSANSEYRFTVRAHNDSGIGPKSEPSEPVLTGPGVPSAPGAPVQLDTSQTTMTLAWSAPMNDGGSPVLRYFLRGSEDADECIDSSAPLEFNTRDASTSMTVRRLRGNTRYIFRIYALNEAGLSAPSPASKGLTTGPIAPAQPTELSVEKAEETTLTLRWKPPPTDGGTTIDQYQIEVALQSAPEEKYVFCTGSVGVIVTGLRGNAYYNCRVRAMNSIGSSAPVEILARTGPVKPGPPGAPRVLGAALATSVTLAWSSPSDDGGSPIDGYTLRGHAYGDNGTESEALCSIDTPGARVNVEGLEPQCRYRFRAQARNQAGIGAFSEWSAIVRTAPPPPPTPEPPSLVAATSQTLTLSWEVGDEMDFGEDTLPLEYEVAITRFDEAEEAGDQRQQQRPSRILRVRTPPAQFKGLRMFTAYTFQLRARGCGGWSEWSESTEPHETTGSWSKDEIVDYLLQRYQGTLSSAFRYFDRDCDGFVNAEDFIRGLDRAGLQAVSEDQKLQLFNEADQAERGVITLRDFSKCFARAPTPSRSRATSTTATAVCSQSESVGYQDDFEDEVEAGAAMANVDTAEPLLQAANGAPSSSSSAPRRLRAPPAPSIATMSQSSSCHTLDVRGRNGRSRSPTQETKDKKPTPFRPAGAQSRSPSLRDPRSLSPPVAGRSAGGRGAGAAGSNRATPSRRATSPPDQAPGSTKSGRSTPSRATPSRTTACRNGRSSQNTAPVQESTPSRQVRGRGRDREALLTATEGDELGEVSAEPSPTADGEPGSACTSNSVSPPTYAKFRPRLTVEGPVQKSSSHRLLLPR